LKDERALSAVKKLWMEGKPCRGTPVINAAAMLEAIAVEQKYERSFWASLIVVAAQKSVAAVFFPRTSMMVRSLTRFRF
jgi:predicted nucleic acid-binding protein